jgi:hypothetical protein
MLWKNEHNSTRVTKSDVGFSSLWSEYSRVFLTYDKMGGDRTILNLGLPSFSRKGSGLEHTTCAVILCGCSRSCFISCVAIGYYTGDA